MPKNEQGLIKERYQVIPRTLIFLINQDKVLLIKGSPQKRLWANRYNGIGGHVERGEDIYASAGRELKEESGLECKNLWLCGSIMIDVEENTGIHLFVFKGMYTGGEIVISNEGYPEWIDQNDILNYALVEDLKTILPVVLKLKKGEMIFARYHYDENERLVINYLTN
ncbi:MAG: NUDIX domain-containing protein [Anaerolineae bacterium]|nr:NUDIX domain-containing protein [Anaerolineae bacterium]